MSKAIKLKNNTYIDSTGIVHNKELLSSIINTERSNIDKLQSYSSSEMDTGKIWIDGRKIYSKSFVKSVASNFSGKVQTGLTNVTILKFDGMAYSSTFTIPLIFYNGYYNFCHMDRKGTYFQIQLNWSCNYIIITIEYVKN